MGGLEKQNMPRVGDVMIYKKDKTLTQCGEFTAQIQTLDIPGEIKLGYSPIGFVRCGRSACRATAFKFKVGKETAGKKLESPHSLKSNEMAQVSFRPQQPMVVDSFKNCEGLSRIAFLDGNTAVMLGKVVSVINKNDMPAEEKPGKKKWGVPLPAGTFSGAAADVPHHGDEKAPTYLLEVPGQLQASRLSTMRAARPNRDCISWPRRRHPFTKESYRIRASCVCVRWPC